MRAALTALKHIYREGLAYKRAGVMLLDLVEAGRAPSLAIRYARSKGRQADRSVRRHQRPAGAGSDPIRPSGEGCGLAVEQRLPLAQLHNPLGRHPEGQDLSTDRPKRRSWHRPTSVKIALQNALCLRQILARRRENEAGAFRVAGTEGERRAFAAPPGDCGNRGPGFWPAACPAIMG